MTDIVERLRWTAVHGDQEDAIAAMGAAAAEIERLRDELWHEKAVVGALRAELTILRNQVAILTQISD